MNAARIAFRTDSSLDVGTGHVMRCLTLADALRERGADCRFICRAHSGNLIDLIRDRGHTVVALAAAFEDSEAATITTDACQTANALADTALDWIIVDHYALDARWNTNCAWPAAA